MRLIARPLVIFLLLMSLTAAGCARAKSDVTADELRPIIERDVIPFEDEAIPPAVAEALSAYQVVIVGEYHQTSGSIALGGRLAVALHRSGLRQVLLECPEAFSWMLDAYVQGTVASVSSITPKMYLPLLDQVRALNAVLPETDRIHVAAIDINHSFSDLRISLGALATLLRDPQAVLDFMSAAGSGTDNTRALAVLRDRIAGDAGLCLAVTGEDLRPLFTELIDIDSRSASLRGTVVSSGAAAAAREKIMKELVDCRLAEANGKSLIYTGYYHAQKTTFSGSEPEFYGRYLHFGSPYAKGKCFSLVIVPAKGELALGGGTRQVDVKKSPENDLFRLMSETARDRIAFLRLSDPIFAERKIHAYYFADTVVAPPSTQFDGFIMLPEVIYEPAPTK